MITEDVLRRIAEAEEGRKLWINLIEKCMIGDNDQVVLFPASYDQWAYYGALYLDDFLKEKHSERAIILCHDERIKECVLACSNKAEIIDFSVDESQKIIALHSLFLFTDNLTIFSPIEPGGKNRNDLIGIKGVTMEEIAALTLYGLKKTKNN